MAAEKKSRWLHLGPNLGPPVPDSEREVPRDAVSDAQPQARAVAPETTVIPPDKMPHGLTVITGRVSPFEAQIAKLNAELAEGKEQSPFIQPTVIRKPKPRYKKLKV